MPWTCPVCKKKFKNRNQEHSCARVPVDAHFKNKPPVIRMIYDRIMQEVQRFGPLTVNPVKSSIQIKAGANFLSVRPKRDRVEIDFFLGRQVGQEPITRSFPVSGNRVLHSAVIEEVGQVDETLVDCLRESYELIRQAN